MSRKRIGSHPSKFRNKLRHSKGQAFKNVKPDLDSATPNQLSRLSALGIPHSKNIRWYEAKRLIKEYLQKKKG